MTTRAFLLAGIAALLAMPAAAQVSDFRLPAQPTPTPTPRVVGPVLGDTPAPTPSPSPTPSRVPTPAPTLSPSPAPAPRVTLPNLPTPTPSAVRRPAPAPGLAPTPTAGAAPGPVTVIPAQPTAGATAIAPAPLPTFAPVGPAAAAPAPPARSYWPWIVFVFLLGGAGFAAVWWLRRRIGPLGPVVVPEIERPRVPPPPIRDVEPQPAAPSPRPVTATPAREPLLANFAGSAQPVDANPLQIAIELRKLTITLVNAVLSYRLTLTNGGGESAEDIAVSADLIGAHASLPREAQLAGPDTELPQRHRLAGIAPGESGEVTGELRVPLHELRPIRQGGAALFVPLARFRIAARGSGPRCFTLVAGEPSPSGNGSVQPVRLDFGPRIYDGLAGRAF